MTVATHRCRPPDAGGRGLRAAAAAHERLAAGPAVEAVAPRPRRSSRALAAGGTVLVFGNGGSAADAQHFVAELVGRFVQTGAPGRRWR